MEGSAAAIDPVPRSGRLGWLRHDEWLEVKLAPAAGLGYATVERSGAELADALPELGLVLAALLPGAAFVSLLNDYTDLEADRLAGKYNRLAGRSRRFAVAAISACLVIGAAFGVLLAGVDAGAAVAYGFAWLAFAAYSAPPIRLKGRGWPGVLADATGAHLAPWLAVAFAVDAGAGSNESVGPEWFVAVGVWALAYGVRGNLAHQLADREADLRAGVATLGAVRPRQAEVAGRYLVFPLECVALAGVLVLAGSWMPVPFLAAYLLVEVQRRRRWDVRPYVLRRPARGQMVLESYHRTGFPVAYLLAAVIADPALLALLAAHLILFGRDLRTWIPALLPTRLAQAVPEWVWIGRARSPERAN